MSAPIDFVRLGAVARKETLQLARDHRSLLLAFVLPLLLLVIFGYAISLDVRDIALAVVDQDRSAASRELVEAFEASGYFTVVARPESPSSKSFRGLAVTRSWPRNSLRPMRASRKRPDRYCSRNSIAALRRR